MTLSKRAFLYAVRIAAVAVILTGALAGAVHGEIIKDLQFDVDGVLPSSDPDIDYFTNATCPECTVFTVEGGFLKQRTFGVGCGNFSYHSNENITLDPTLNIVMEARLRILQLEEGHPEYIGGAFFQVFDGDYRYTLWFTVDGVVLQGGEEVIIDTSVFRTYRIETPGNSNITRLFIDDTLVSDVFTTPYDANEFSFGDGISSYGNNADVDWDYIVVENGGEITAAPGETPPQRLMLAQPVPNPFNPQTTVTFSLPRTEWADISVFDVTGRLVTTLTARTLTAGPHSLTWNGCDSQGRALPSGSYLIRLSTESGVEVRKAVLVR